MRMTAGIVLAAGESRRMRAGAAGALPKQVMKVGGVTLLGRAIGAARGAGLSPIVVVLGAFSQEIRAGVAELAGTHVVENEGWARGMGSSLHAGLEGVLRVAPEAEAVLVTVCDQPRVGVAELRRLLEAREATGKGLVAAAYGGAARTVGAPAIISRKYFEAVRGLDEAAGAKVLFVRFAEDVACVEIPAAGTDVDDVATYEKLVIEEGGTP
jgi:CTP:molybdopterin cytidylyltransferase MocA